jgi:general secretion pathway protein G
MDCPRDGPAAEPCANRTRRRRAGFTLVELLVVLVILGLLAGLAVPQVLQYLAKAKSATATVVVQNIDSALDFFRLDMGRFPTQDEGLAALVERPGDAARWNGPYLKSQDMLEDPWGNPYHYQRPGEHGRYDIFSLGADNQEGGEDEDRDIGNW